MPDRLTERPADRAQWMRQRYFSTVSAITLVLTLWGFSDNLVWRVGQRSNSDPKFIAHGLSCLAWMCAFFVQSKLVRAGNVRLHRRLGTVAMLAAVCVVLSTTWVFIAVWKGWAAMPVYAQANRLFLPSFAVCVLLAYLSRRTPEWHKRYLLLATLYMMEPVLSRAFDPLDPVLRHIAAPIIDTSWMIFFLLTWNGLFLSMFAYDRMTSGTIHRLTVVGYVWFWLVWGIVAVA